MKNKVKSIASAILLLPLLASCASKEEYEDRVIYGMNTYITLRVPKENVDDEIIDEAERECARIVAKDEKLMSSHSEDGVIYRLNNDVDAFVGADESLLTVLDASLRIEELTGGAFSPSLGALTELWNVEDGGPVPSESAINEALSLISSDSIKLENGNVKIENDGCKIDLGGIAKGYAAQEIVDYLASTDIPYGLVSVGGNVGVFGSKESGERFKVGISNPDDTSSVVGYVYMNSGFLSVSGDYERFFEEDGRRYHHIIDPATGYPAESGLRSVAVLSKDGAYSDALSTALFVMGAERGMEFYREGRVSFEAVFITDGGEIILTDGLSDGDFELSSDSYKISKG